MIGLLAQCPRRLLIALVRAYRLLLSPWLGGSCRFTPTCSAYSLQALEAHGALVGSCLTARRLLRCGPWCEGGHDPVPERSAKSFQPPTARLNGGSAACVCPDTRRGAAPAATPGSHP